MEPVEPPILPMPAPIAKIHKGSSFVVMPDGERVLVAGATRAWMASLVTGDLLFEYEKPARFVSRIAVSGDGTLAAMAQSGGRITLYDAQTGKKENSLKVSEGGDVSGLAFAPNSHVLLHSNWRNVTVVDVDDTLKVCSLKASEAYPNNTQHYTITFAASGNCFACLWSGHTTTDISLFQWPSRDETKSLSVETDKQSYRQSHVFSRMAFSPDEKSILLTAPDGLVTLHSLTDGASKAAGISLLAEVTWEENAIRFFLGDICFSPDGTLLAYKLNGVLGLWAWPSSKCLGKWRASGPKPYRDHMGFSNSGRELVISFGGSPSGIFVYHTADFINSDLGQD